MRAKRPAPPARKGWSWRSVRIAFLLLVLGAVGLDAWLTHTRSIRWKYPLRVSIYPLAADGRKVTRDYVSGLQPADVAAIEEFFQHQARDFGVSLERPVAVTLRPPLAALPPARAPNAGALDTVWWSLQLRWWAHRIEADMPRPRSQVRIFVLYYDPAVQPRVAHSLGLQKGLIGVVHAFAAPHMTQTNNVIIAHELLHTLGATDKYDPATGLPRYPDGYAEPDRSPRYPQPTAELMAGRTPLAANRAEIPESLDAVIVGPATAREIGWVRS